VIKIDQNEGKQQGNTAMGKSPPPLGCTWAALSHNPALRASTTGSGH